MGNKVGNPWKGLRSYQEGEILYGRDEEIQALSQYVINNTQTVLYGRSGIGKTSILNAGIFPVARAEGLYPVSIRLDHTDRFDYVAQLATALTEAGLTAHELVRAVDAENENLWEFFHRQYFTRAGDTQKVQPLFVFDQFEEIFTLQKNEKVKLQFFSQLGDLLNDICPFYADDSAPSETTHKTDGNLEDLSLDDLLSDEEEKSSDYLTNPSFHMVFALREDFLSYLERYTAFIPVMKNNRFSLQPVNEEQAADIIMKPRPGLVDVEVATLIIRKVTGRSDFTLDGIPELEVDSAVLSLYLDRLYEKMDKDAGRISGELVDKFGDDIIKEFYKDSISDLSPQDVQILETVLLTREGRRNNVSRTDLLAKGLEEPVLNRLVDERKLLRQFSYGDDIRIEFIHDILCPVVQQHIRDRELDAIKQQQKEQEALRHLENRKRNQQRAKNELDVLTIRGRMLVDNQRDFGSFVNLMEGSPVKLDWLSYIVTKNNCLGFEHRYLRYESVDFSGMGKIISTSDDGAFTTCLEFLGEDGHTLPTEDGICKLQLHFVDNRIKSVSFVGRDDTPYFKNGYCGIELDYDKEGREVRRTYVDQDGMAARTIDGYACVVRSYDADGNVADVKYLDAKGAPCRHTDGNYGFRSSYDADGLEIGRVFLDEEGNPAPLLSGIYGRAFKYDSDDRLSEECNLGPALEPAPDRKGFMSVSFEYDDKSRLKKETYRDFAGQPVLGNDNYSITFYSYKEENGLLVEEELYADTDGCPVQGENGEYGHRFFYDHGFRMLEIGDLDADGNYTRIFGCKWGTDGVPYQLVHDEGSFWLEYDQHGLYIFRYGLLDGEGKKVEQDRGGFGSEVERNPSTGFPVASINLDRYNQRCPDENGVYRLVFVKIAPDGEVLEERYENREGDPVANSIGAYGRIKDFDDNNNLIQETFLGITGSPTPLMDSEVVYVVYEYDKENRETARRYFDIHRRPAKYESGVYGTITEYGKSWKKQLFVDQNDRPMDNDEGYCWTLYELDEKERLSRTASYTKEGALFEEEGEYCFIVYSYDDDAHTTTYQYLDKDKHLKESGLASICIEVDDQGREVKTMGYDKDGNGVFNEDGECGYAMEYGEDGHSTLHTSLGVDGLPTVNSKGYCSIKKVFDSQGREIECFYFDEKGLPMHDGLGYGCRSIYFSEGNRYIYVNLDADGKPMCNLSDRYCAIEKTMDSLDRIVLERYLDDQLEPTMDSSGCFGRSWTYEEDGIEEECRLDSRNNPMPDSLGQAYCLKQIDDQGRVVFEQPFDVDHRPILNEPGSYVIWMGIRWLGRLDSREDIGHMTMKAGRYWAWIWGWTATLLPM